jgi:outer membrane receptor protein involved in Fe transport
VIASGRFESQGSEAGLGEFRFGDDTDFAAATGAWRGLEPTTGSGSFRMSERALFVQDSWSVTEGLALTFGMRFDRNSLPVGEIDRNAAWLARTGIDNTDVRGDRSRVAPRIGFRWELGSERQWVFESTTISLTDAMSPRR